MFPVFGGNKNLPKLINHNQAHLTVEIADLIVYEGLSFNIYRKHKFMKVLELERFFKMLHSSKQNMISKHLLDIIDFYFLHVTV